MSILGLGPTIIVFILGIIIFVLAGLDISYPSIKKIINIRRTLRMNIGTLPTEGLVQFVGKAEQATAISPISQTKCVVWQVEVQEKRSLNSKGGTSWFTIWEGKSTAPFKVYDDTGNMWVDPTRADVFLQQGMDEKGGWFDSLSPKTLDAIAGLGIKTKGFWGLNKDLRVKESLLSIGKDIYVLGTVESSDGYKKIKMVGDNPFLISDHGINDLLPELYFNVAKWVILITLIGGGLLCISFFGTPGSGGAH
jgi:hypothetical protein